MEKAITELARLRAQLPPVDTNPRAGELADIPQTLADLGLVATGDPGQDRLNLLTSMGFH